MLLPTFTNAPVKKIRTGGDPPIRHFPERLDSQTSPYRILLSQIDIPRRAAQSSISPYPLDITTGCLLPHPFSSLVDDVLRIWLLISPRICPRAISTDAPRGPPINSGMSGKMILHIISPRVFVKGTKVRESTS